MGNSFEEVIKKNIKEKLDEIIPNLTSIWELIGILPVNTVDENQVTMLKYLDNFICTLKTLSSRLNGG